MPFDLNDDGDENLSSGDLQQALLGDEPSGLGDTMQRGEVDADADSLLNIEPEAAPDEPPPADPAPVDDSDFFKTFNETYGIDLSAKYRSADDALKGLAESYKLVGKHDEEAQWGRRLLESPEKVYEYLHQRYNQGSRAAAPQQPATPTGDPNAQPEWDDSWQEMLDPATGQPKPGADPAVLAKIRKYNDFVKKRGSEIIRDGMTRQEVDGLLKKQRDDLLAEVAKQQKQQWDEINVQTEHARRMDAEARALINEEAGWAYVDGDPRKGPTDAGKIFGRYLNDAAAVDPNTGMPRITDLRTQRDWAKMKTALELRQSAPAATAQQRTAPTATRKPNVSPPATVDPNAPWPKGKRLEEELMQFLGE